MAYAIKAVLRSCILLATRTSYIRACVTDVRAMIHSPYCNGGELECATTAVQLVHAYTGFGKAST